MGTEILYQHSFEQPALCDVKAAILGQNLDVLDFIIEPVKDKWHTFC